MKVMLLQDVKTIGKKDQIYEVSDGYARNYLIPRKLAVPADAAAMNIVKTKQDAKEHHAAEALTAARELAAKVEGRTVVLRAKGGAAGKLYGKITSKDVALELSKLIGSEVDKRKVEMGRDIREFGVHPCSVRLHPGVTASFKVKVDEQL